MKKFLALTLAAALCVSNAATALADTGSQKVSEMLSLLKSRIGATDEYDKFSSDVNSYGGETRYEFSWSKTDGDNRSNMNITMNGEGVVTSYHVYNSNIGGSGKASINHPQTSEALDAAVAGFKKLNPDIAENVKITSNDEYRSLRADEFSFSLQRVQNGIPVKDDDGWLSVSADAQKIVSFNLNYTEGLEFEDSSKILSKEDAQKKFNESFGMKLRYVTDYKDDTKTATLIYSPEKEYNSYISATTGEVVKREFERHNRGGAGFSSGDAKNESAQDSAFSEAETANLDTLNGLISLDEAQKVILSSKVINASSAYKPTRHSLYHDWYDKNKYTYRLEFEKSNSDDDYDWLYADVDAQNGDILSFLITEGESAKKTKLTVQQGYEKAADALKILAPSHFGDNPDYLLDGDDKDDSGNYVFVRYVNGIEFSDNTARVSINMETGKIFSYCIKHDDMEFPSADGVISAEDAGKKLFEQVGYDVYYIPTYTDEKPTKALLVYDTDNYDLTLDAFGGELKYKSDSEKIGKYTDIENHYAKNAIEALATFGIGFSDSEFKPDSNITQADFVTLLNAAFNNRGPVVIYKGFSYDNIYNRAISDGIVKDDEYSPDSDVTRNLAAKMLIRALDLEEVATLEGIYIPRFSDVDADNVGYTSILCAMGVISGDENGNFNPNSTVTRADAAIMLYNYLSK